jgi:acyl-CoA thioesterase
MDARSVFDQAVVLDPLDEGRWRAHIDPGWNIGDAPNGGYLVSLAVAALARTLPHPDPFAVTAHFPSRTGSGADALIESRMVRAGRSLSMGTAVISQGGSARVHVTGTFGALQQLKGPTNVAGGPPANAPPEQCVRAVGGVGPAPEFVNRFDLRMTPESAMWAVGKPLGRADMQGWVRFVDGRDADPASLCLFADSFPPAVFNIAPARWVPTIELTVHVRGRPAPGWLQARFLTRYLINGYLEEDGELWDSSGALVALSRQLARMQG